MIVAFFLVTHTLTVMTEPQEVVTDLRVYLYTYKDTYFFRNYEETNGQQKVVLPGIYLLCARFHALTSGLKYEHILISESLKVMLIVRNCIYQYYQIRLYRTGRDPGISVLKCELALNRCSAHFLTQPAGCF